MSIFHSIFEQNLDVTINSDGNIEFESGGAEFTPMAILKSDPAAYKAEFRAWLNDVWLDTHRSRLRSLRSLRNNDKRFADLCAATASGAIVPMIGSGMSYASGFPLWRDFLHRLRQFSSLSEDDLNAMLDRGEFEEAVDRLAVDLAAPLFNEQIEHNLRVEAATIIDGPVRLLPELFPSLVLTTNLDDVLEHVYEANNRRLQYPLAGRDIERYRRLHGGGSSCLLKLHGDCRRDDGRVLGVTEYTTAYGVGGVPREALSLIYRTRPLLWLGCSLTVDRTVALAGELASVDSKMPKHFAFLQQPSDDTVWRARENELTARQIFPIWYDGDHDECIETLLVGLLDFQRRFEALT